MVLRLVTKGQSLFYAHHTRRWPCWASLYSEVDDECGRFRCKGKVIRGRAELNVAAVLKGDKGEA